MSCTNSLSLDFKNTSLYRKSYRIPLSSFCFLGLDPIQEARAAVEAKVIIEAYRKKAGVQVKMIKAGAVAEVQRNPEVKVKTS